MTSKTVGRSKNNHSGLYSGNEKVAINENEKTKGIHTGLKRWIKNNETNPGKPMQYGNAHSLCIDELDIDVSELLILD